MQAVPNRWAFFPSAFFTSYLISCANFSFYILILRHSVSDGSSGQNQPDLIQPRTSASSIVDSNRPILHDPLEPNFGHQDRGCDDELLLNDEHGDPPAVASASWQVRSIKILIQNTKESSFDKCLCVSGGQSAIVIGASVGTSVWSCEERGTGS